MYVPHFFILWAYPIYTVLWAKHFTLIMVILFGLILPDLKVHQADFYINLLLHE